jgi:bla regulator protein BlaR1
MMQIISEAVVAIGDSFALSLVIKATVVAALALIGARMIRGSRASVRHLLLAAVFIVLLALPFGAWIVPSIQVEVPALQRLVPSPPITPAGDEGSTALRNGTAGAAAASHRLAGQGISIPGSALIAAGWLGGTLLFVLPMTAGLWQLRRIRRFGAPWLRGEAILRGLAGKAGIKRKVELLLHDAVPGPMTCGILRPAIVCPPDVQSWNEADLQRAMVHELEHIRRGDCLMHGVARLVCAFYWFHPLVWILWRKLSLEAERACDDAVLRSADATEYADQLVTLAERMTTGAGAPLLAMASRGDLTMRIAAVLDARQRRGRPGALSVAAALTAAALLIMVISPLRAVSMMEERELAQAPAARQEFEVASVKPNKSGNSGGSFGGRPGGLVVVVNNTLRNIVRNVWNLQEFQIVGGPDWINQDRWDIEARAPQGQPTQQQMMLMMRSLLADRFKLAVHNETREIPVYALVLARPDGKFGPQFRRSELDCGAIRAAVEKGAPPPARPADRPFCGTQTRPGMVMTSGVLLADFARNLSPSTGRIVIDKTGLTGFFDLELKFTPDQLGAGAGDPATDVPSLFVAIQEQLGLKLEAQRAPVDVLVIDSAQRAVEN